MRIKRYLYHVGIALSMLINVIFGGLIGQTLSARQHDLRRSNKMNLSRFIDLFCGDGHCRLCWAYWKVR